MDRLFTEEQFKTYCDFLEREIAEENARKSVEIRDDRYYWMEQQGFSDKTKRRLEQRAWRLGLG